MPMAMDAQMGTPSNAAATPPAAPRRIRHDRMARPVFDVKNRSRNAIGRKGTGTMFGPAEDTTVDGVAVGAAHHHDHLLAGLGSVGAGPQGGQRSSPAGLGDEPQAVPDRAAELPRMSSSCTTTASWT